MSTREQMRVFHLGQRVLSSQKPLRGRAVPLSLAVLLECIGYRDRPETNQVERTAYLIIIALHLLHRYCPFIASIAASDASKLA